MRWPMRGRSWPGIAHGARSWRRLEEFANPVRVPARPGMPGFAPRWERAPPTRLRPVRGTAPQHPTADAGRPGLPVVGHGAPCQGASTGRAAPARGAVPPASTQDQHQIAALKRIPQGVAACAAHRTARSAYRVSWVGQEGRATLDATSVMFIKMPHNH